MNPYSEHTLIHAVYECISAIEYKQMTKISVVDPLTLEQPDTKILRSALSKVARKLNCKISTRTRGRVLFARKERLPDRNACRIDAPAVKKKSVAKQVAEALQELKPRDATTIIMKDLNMSTVRTAITYYSQATGKVYMTSAKRDKNLFVRRIK